ncbi:MAG: glycosyltransferase, partial [bacterium]
MKKTKIVVVFSSHLSDAEDSKFTNHVMESIGVKYSHVVCYKNHNQYSLPELYNKALKEYSSNDTIIVFCHNDILFRTKNWGRLLLNKFNNTNFDVIGVAGTTFLNNGVWWTDRTKMVGIVDHTDGIQEWTSTYSPERKGHITPTVLIDGLFMAVNPENLEHYFDEDFKGFHLYDLSFCIPNYLDGCNIGVTTDIRILHKSVGQTNEQWEENRKQFVEKYKDELPIKHVSEDKLKVLICCQFFKNLTGSEMSNYELSKELVKLGCDVTVVSSLIGEPLMSKAVKAGVKVYGLANAPNYGVGQDNKLVFLNNEVDFDIIHINHKPIGEMILQMYPNTPAVMHVRSEVIPVYEEPIIHPVIKKYISIRDSITEYIKGFGISEDLITHIDNPFDTTRFNTNYEPIKNDREVVLFVGTHDYLRKAMLFDLVDKTREKNQDL